MGTVSGPMFERARSGPWESLHRKDGAHYNTYACHDVDGMDAIREMFPDGQADEFNVCLFSTSGVHGTYATIEEVEAWVLSGAPYDCFEEGEEPEGLEDATFLILHPRIVCTRHGNCQPKTPEDFALLKRLRETSWESLATIGRPTERSGSDG